MNNNIRVGITHGDTNGIGYEVILKALADERMVEICTPVIYGSAKVASFYRKAMELEPVQLNRINSADEARDGVCNIINVVGEDLKIEPGQATEAAGAAAFAALEAAVTDLRNGDIDVLVTAPINKHSIQSASFSFPGHTEYLEASFSIQDGGPDDNPKALMVMCTDYLRVALVTTHIPLAKVAETVTEELILERLAQFNSSLKRDFAIYSPRIGVLSINPHAGEEGLLGNEEKDVIVPAIEKARAKGILAFGPYAADGLFGSGGYTAFDGILAMYHDQGLTPFKTLAMDSGVNFTAGLPGVRTSPDHGTGYDIAGKGEASPESMRAAIFMAIDVFRRRADYDRAYSHPLRRQTDDRKNKDDKRDDRKNEPTE